MPASPTTTTTPPRPVRRHRSMASGEHGELVRAPDERTGRGGTERDPGTGPGLATQRMERHRDRLAAQHDRTAVLDGEAATGRRERRTLEQDLARARQRLDACGGRDRLPGQAKVPAGSEASGDHLAGRDPDPNLHRVPAVAEFVESGADRHRRQRGPDGIVVMGARPAEDGEYGVADELLAGAVEARDGIGHRCQGARDASTDFLGIELGDHPDVVDEVGEQGRDDAPVAGLRSRGRVRRSAEIR